MTGRVIVLLLSFFWAVLASGCSREAGTPQTATLETAAGAATASLTPAESTPKPPTPEPPTSTPAPPVAVLLVPPGAAPWLSGPIRRVVENFSAQSALILQEHTSFETLDADEKVQLAVILPGAAGLQTEIAARPETSFLAIGIPGLGEAPNLSQIGPDGLRPDRQAFLAGHLAALATADWRVAILTEAGSPAGAEHRVAFVNGARYFCGLCRPTVPPFAAYPLFDEVPAGADEATQQAAADRLLAQGVRTIFLQPEIETAFLQAYLAAAGTALIGTQPGVQEVEGQWLASVLPAPESAIEDLWAALLEASGAVQVPLPFRIEPGTDGLLSPGRLALARSVIPELLAGFCDTGAGPASEAAE